MTLTRPRTKAIAVLGALCALAFSAAPATAAEPDLSALEPGVDYVAGELLVQVAGQTEQQVQVPGGVAIDEAAAALDRNPHVSYAVPNYIARADAFPNPPNDPANLNGTGSWEDKQWNFLNTPGVGVDAQGAWQNLYAAGPDSSGANGIKIAVVDSGIAYDDYAGHYARSPDFGPGQFLAGYDFVGKDSRPLDEYGHGTHVAGTIAQRVNNGTQVTNGDYGALTGLAFKAKLIPVRVLNRRGAGSAAQVADGIRFAANKGAKVMNLSFTFPLSLDGNDVPGVAKALKYAKSKGTLVVAAAGNQGKSKIAYPAAGSAVVSVGASTGSGCLAGFSNRGNGSTARTRLDIAAPGGGRNDPSCLPSVNDSLKIHQVTIDTSFSNFKHFDVISHVGTSQASPHVTGTAAMVIASGVVGSQPTLVALINRLKATGSALPAPFGYARLVNARCATKPGPAAPPPCP